MGEASRTTTEEARQVGDAIGVDWDRFDLEQFRAGMDVEYEHGTHDAQTDVTGDDPIITGKTSRLVCPSATWRHTRHSAAVSAPGPVSSSRGRRPGPEWSWARARSASAIAPHSSASSIALRWASRPSRRRPARPKTSGSTSGTTASWSKQPRCWRRGDRLARGLAAVSAFRRSSLTTSGWPGLSEAARAGLPRGVCLGARAFSRPSTVAWASEVAASRGRDMALEPRQAASASQRAD